MAEWRFLAPWLELLRGKIWYIYSEREEEISLEQRRRLTVSLPRRRDFLREEDFHSAFTRAREALALLAAVEAVDYSAWRFCLVNYCSLSLQEEGHEKFEERIPVFYMLLMDLYRKNIKEEEDDLVGFCGTEQREFPRHAFLKAMAKVAAMGGENFGRDLEIPVRASYRIRKNEHVDKLMSVFTNVETAENTIKEQWEKYNSSHSKRDLKAGKLRCTFVLEPLMMDLNHIEFCPELTALMEHVVLTNCWLSKLSLLILTKPPLLDNARGCKENFGKLMARIFESGRRSPTLANTAYHSGPSHEDNPLQLGTIHLECVPALRGCDYEAMCSAMVLNQTTKKMSLRLEMQPEDPVSSGQAWKWLAYALFSKRARQASSIETLALILIQSMTVADMKGFVSVLESDHPEEEILGLPRGVIAERDAVLIGGAPIRWQFDDNGEPVLPSRVLSFQWPILSVRTISDDGNSAWVNALVPGFGRCQVQRRDLVFHEQDSGNTTSTGLKSLTIGFSLYMETIADGLPLLLAAVGSSLECLTIYGPYEALDVNLISRTCPNVKKLSLGGKTLVDLRLDFSDYHDRKLPLPALKLNWDDIAELSKELCAPDSPLTKCLCGLRVRTTELEAGYDEEELEQLYQPRIATDLQALLRMLELNRSLKYLDVVVPPQYHSHLHEFREYHSKRIRPEKLSMARKIAFLSVLSCGKQLEPTKKRKRSNSRCSVLDQHVLSIIFEFAATPVYRQVYFREPTTDYNDWDASGETFF